MPFFSVIIPAYNAEAYLGECLASVADQTFGDFELVAVDDGSTDSTLEILERFAAEQTSISVILVCQENRGRLSARRAGLESASGEYVVFLDSDDCLRFDALQVLARAIDETRVDIVMFGMSHEFDYSCSQYCRDLPFGVNMGQGYGLAKRATLQGDMNTIWGKAIALAAFDMTVDYKPFWGLMHGEDLFQLLPVMDRARSCMHLEKALYFYRRHSGASTMSYRPAQLDSISAVAGRLLQYGESWGMLDAAAYGALRNFCSTAKILINDPASHEIRDAELNRMSEALQGLGLDAALAGQRLDDRLLLRAILGGHHRQAAALVGVVEFLKSVSSIAQTGERRRCAR